MTATHIRFPEIRPFDCRVTYGEVRSAQEEPQLDPHTHPECEIYVNLSGDVSFMVENHVYPISRGSVILTRPNEFHHCIYHSFSEIHRNIWILFSPSENDALLQRFFDRPNGCENLIQLSAESLDEVDRLCRTLSDSGISKLMHFTAFFKLLSILEENRFSEAAPIESPLPPDVRFALDYIQKNYSFPFPVSEIAAEAHVSINTLERHFRSAMKVSPSEFLKERRLAIAQTLLRSGTSVMEAAEQSGFSDYSNFIALFRKRFGMTPLQYKKQYR